MKYTYQELSESGSFGSPYGNDVKYARNKSELFRAFDDWRREHWRVGSSASDAVVRVWKGEWLADVTDIYPDFDITGGKRGGVAVVPC